MGRQTDMCIPHYYSFFCSFECVLSIFTQKKPFLIPSSKKPNLMHPCFCILFVPCKERNHFLYNFTQRAWVLWVGKGKGEILKGYYVWFGMLVGLLRGCVVLQPVLLNIVSTKVSRKQLQYFLKHEAMLHIFSFL